jgi:hypothetical protein
MSTKIKYLIIQFIVYDVANLFQLSLPNIELPLDIFKTRLSIGQKVTFWSYTKTGNFGFSKKFSFLSGFEETSGLFVRLCFS